MSKWRVTIEAEVEASDLTMATSALYQILTPSSSYMPGVKIPLRIVRAEEIPEPKEKAIA